MEIMKFENFKHDSSRGRGWVNIKVDNDMYVRMSRYVSVLDRVLFIKGSTSKEDKYNLFKKVELLSTISSLIKDNDIAMKDKVSLITILQYLKELRRHFNDSSSGFLLEGFLAALIHGELKAGRGPVDLEGNNYTKPDEEEEDYDDLSKSYAELDVAEFETVPEDQGEKKLKYQIKLYKAGNNIKVNVIKECNYYVICLKRGGNIDVHILTPKQIRSDKFAVIQRGGKMDDPDKNVRIGGVNGTKRYVELNTTKFENNNFKVTLQISNLDLLIKESVDTFKDLIDEIYLKLSDLHYDIDSLITGVDKNNKLVSSDVAQAAANTTIEAISNQIGKLIEKKY